MQIKIEKFLALTAMLATTQITACVADDGGDSNNGKEDSGLSTGDTSDEDPGHEDPSEEGSVEAGPSDEEGPSDEGSAEAGPSDEGPSTQDAGSEQPADAGDAAAIDASFSDASAFDAATDGSADASTEGDPTSEDLPDAATELLCGPDAADELFFENCFVFDGCYEAEAGTGGIEAASVCYEHYYNKRALVALDFWDCYGSAGVEDPCTEEADIAAHSCADAAAENACIEERDECATLAANCSELTVEDCNNAISPYNSAYLSVVSDCTLAAFTTFGPDYEGCAVDVYSCIASPDAE